LIEFKSNQYQINLFGNQPTMKGNN